jgi:hypothetical protein
MRTHARTQAFVMWNPGRAEAVAIANRIVE